MELSQIYTKHFFQDMQRTASCSAMAMVPLVLELIKPKSVIDIGCGTGDWLQAFREYGVDDILGIDGEYVHENLLAVPQENIKTLDLSKPFVLDRTYDLALCLEVAEHLAPECASDLVESLTHLAPIILFSSAIPFQGGTHHVNEQWPEYWAKLFKRRGFVPVDALRKMIWDNNQIEVWYRQNVMFFCNEQIVFSNNVLEKAFRATDPSSLTIVHPEFFVYRAKTDKEYIALLEHMTFLAYIKRVVRNILRN